jgi:hypothetical protein
MSLEDFKTLFLPDFLIANKRKKKKQVSIVFVRVDIKMFDVSIFKFSFIHTTPTV